MITGWPGDEGGMNHRDAAINNIKGEIVNGVKMCRYSYLGEGASLYNNILIVYCTQGGFSGTLVVRAIETANHVGAFWWVGSNWKLTTRMYCKITKSEGKQKKWTTKIAPPLREDNIAPRINLSLQLRHAPGVHALLRVPLWRCRRRSPFRYFISSSIFSHLKFVNSASVEPFLTGLFSVDERDVQRQRQRLFWRGIVPGPKPPREGASR